MYVEQKTAHLKKTLTNYSQKIVALGNLSKQLNKEINTLPDSLKFKGYELHKRVQEAIQAMKTAGKLLKIQLLIFSAISTGKENMDTLVLEENSTQKPLTLAHVLSKDMSLTTASDSQYEEGDSDIDYLTISEEETIEDEPAKEN